MNFSAWEKLPQNYEAVNPCFIGTTFNQGPGSQWQRSDLDFKLGVSGTRKHPGKTHLHFRGEAVGIIQRWCPAAVSRRRVTVGAGGGSVFRVCKVHPGSQHLVIWGGVPGKAASGQSLQPSLKFCEFSNPDSYFTSTSTPCCCLFAQSCPTLCDSMDYSLLGSSVHGISQARILEWVAIPFSRGSSQPRDRTLVFYMGRRILYHWATREVHYYCYDYYYLQWILLFATRNPGGCTFFHPHYGECYL